MEKLSFRALHAVLAYAHRLAPWKRCGLAAASPVLMALVPGADGATYLLAAALLVMLCGHAGGVVPALSALATATVVSFVKYGAFGPAPTTLHAQLMFVSLGGFSAWLISKRRRAAPQHPSTPSHAPQDIFHDVFDNVPSALMIVRLSDGQLVAVNSAFSDLWGYTSAQALGRSSAQLSLWVEEDQLIQKLKANNHSDTQELQARTAAGQIRDVLATVRLIHFQGAAHLLVAAADVTDRRRSAELEHLANHDALTSLPNRLLLQRRLQRASDRAAEGQLSAVLFIDLDGFKQVNDSLGHAAGDELLRLAALRMKSRTRSGDVLARLGGDEFVVLLENLTRSTEAEAVAADLMACISKPFVLTQGKEVRISASLGISSFDPLLADGAVRACEQADAALYTAKRAGRNAVHVFGAEAPSVVGMSGSHAEEPATCCSEPKESGE